MEFNDEPAKPFTDCSADYLSFLFQEYGVNSFIISRKMHESKVSNHSITRDYRLYLLWFFYY